MSIFKAALLGILQGLTEFFPVSSSGHLKLFEHLLGMQNLSNLIAFDLVCHLGTLLAIVCVFYRDLIELFRRRDFALIVIATSPLFLVYPFLSNVESFFDQPRFLGFFFALTALLLFLGDRLFASLNFRFEQSQAFFIGVFQAFALFPGVSRSGATISAAKILGWESQKAARFSFLMSIPPILGGSFLKLILKPNALFAQISPLQYLTGFFFSFIVGLMALRFMLRMLRSSTLWPFCIYCSVLSILSLVVL